jgi:hypothetical protein
MSRQAQRVASRFVHKLISSGWQPSIPQAFMSIFLGDRQAYVPDTKSLVSLDEARDSVGVFIPKILELLKKRNLGDRYYVNATESRGRIFYFMTTRDEVDSFNMTLAMQGPKAHISFGFTPYKLDGTPDFKKMITKQALAEPETAGLAMMRLVRIVLAEL